MSSPIHSMSITASTVSPLSDLLPEEEKQRIQKVIDGKTKPLGALGKMEDMMQLLASCAWLRNKKASECLVKPQVMVFAGDHGIAAEGVSIATSEVTALMVDTFLSEKSSVSVCAKQVGAALEIIDCGILYPRESAENLVSYRLGQVTNPIQTTAAMTREQAIQGLQNGRKLAEERSREGMDILCIGELGIGNTSAAAALMSGLTGIDPEHCVGVGTGIDSEALKRKQTLVRQSVERAAHSMTKAFDSEATEIDATSAIHWAAEVGGFEIVTMAGAIIGAAEQQIPVVVDGFVSSVSALLACQLVPAVRDYLIFSHKGSEHGHNALLEILRADPLMDLGLRIGEGTGAVLALSLLKSSLACYVEMASFEEAGIAL